MYGYPCDCPRICLCWINADFVSLNIYFSLEVVVLCLLPSCQVWENCRGNSGNSGHQVQTYEMLEGTSASAYVLHPFQTLVPRFQNEEDGRSEIGVLE